MATTALQLIKDAMSKIAVFPDESSLQNSETELFRRLLNSMMADWKARSMDLGFTEISSTTETLTVPEGSIRAITYNLAVEAAPDFLGSEAPPFVVRQADKSMRAVRSLTKIDMNSPLPETTPLGSGNVGRETYIEEYYPLATPISYLSNDGFTVTISAADTPVVMGGSNWVEEALSLFESTQAGRSTFTGANTTVSIKANIYAEVASGTDALTFWIAKNGVVIAESAVQVESTAGTNQQITLKADDVEIYKDDYIELYCQNNDAAVDITVNSANKVI